MANDHDGSSDDAIRTTLAKSQLLSLYGSAFWSIVALGAEVGRSMLLPSSGPVTESNGLRERIADALVV